MTSPSLSLFQDPLLATATGGNALAGLLQSLGNRDQTMAGGPRLATSVSMDFTQLLSGSAQPRPVNLRPGLPAPVTVTIESVSDVVVPTDALPAELTFNFVTAPRASGVDPVLPSRQDIEEATAAVAGWWELLMPETASVATADVPVATGQNEAPAQVMGAELIFGLPGNESAPTTLGFSEPPKMGGQSKGELQGETLVSVPSEVRESVSPKAGVTVLPMLREPMRVPENTVKTIPAITGTDRPLPETAVRTATPTPVPTSAEPVAVAARNSLVVDQVSVEWTFPSGAKVRMEPPVRNAMSMQPESRAESLAAEFAALPAAPTAKSLAGRLAEQKIFLSPDKQSVIGTLGEAGIDVAKADFTMPAKVISTRSSAEDTSQPMGLSLSAEALSSGSEMAPEITSSDVRSLARNAVAAIAKAVDAQLAMPTGNSSSVDLKLRLADDDLSIRVELRDGEVHTSFRTDSAVLRAALGQEWHGVVAEMPARALRYLEPQISGADRPSANSFSSEEHSSGQHAPSRSPDEFTGRRLSGGRRGRPGNPVVEAARHAPVYLNTLHLSTFA